MAAAVTTARAGLKTLLIDSQGTLGGLATNGYVTGVAGMVEGFCKEFLDRLEAEGDLYRRPHLPAIDPEKGKFMLERMVLEAGAAILYWTYAIDVVTEDRLIKKVICHSKSGRMEISAKIYIDTTGDADIAAYAGVPYEVGSPEFGGLNMSTTLSFRMAGVNLPDYWEAMQNWQKEQKTGYMSLFADKMEEAVANGDLPYFIFPTALIYQIPRTPPENADITVMTTHSFYTRNTDVEDLTRQAIEQHRQIAWVEKFLQKYIPGFEKSRLTGVASLHGVRDSRRIVGEYVLKDEDVACAKKFADGIAKFPEFFDTHHPTNPRIGFIRHIHLPEPKEPAVCRPAQCSSAMHPFVKPGGFEARVNPREYCEIPYRSLVPLKIDNLRGRQVRFRRVSCPGGGACHCNGNEYREAVVPLPHSHCKRSNTQGTGRRLVRQTLIDKGVPLDKAPDGHWANVRELHGEFVVIPGDFVALKLRRASRPICS